MSGRSDSPAPSPSGWPHRLALGAVLCLALALALPGFRGPTDTSAPWVIDNVLHYMRALTRHSQYMAYPMLQANCLAAVIAAYLGGGLVTGALSRPEAYALLADPFQFMALARGLSLAFALAALVATYHMGRLLGSRRVGLLAALLLALTPTFTDYSHEGVPDAAMTCGAAFACLAFLAWMRNPSLRNAVLVGMCLGLAVSAKYNAGVVAVAVLLTWAWLRRREGPPYPGPWDRRLLWALGAGLLAFAVTSFQVLLEPRPYLHSVLVYERDYKLLAYSARVDPATFVPWWSTLVVAFQSERGMALLFVAGLLFALLRRTPATCFLALIAVLSLAYMGRWRMALMRFYLFAYPGLAALAALALADTWRRLRAAPGARRALPLALAALAALPVVGIGVAEVQQSLSLLRPDTRDLARDWIEARIPSGAVIAGPQTPEGYPNLVCADNLQGYLTGKGLPDSLRPTVAALLNRRPHYALLGLEFEKRTGVPASWPERIRRRYARSIYATRTLDQDVSLAKLRQEKAQYVVTSSTWSQSYLRYSSPDELPPYDPRRVHFEDYRVFYTFLEGIRPGERKDGLLCLARFAPEPGAVNGPALAVFQLVH